VKIPLVKIRARPARRLFRAGLAATVLLAGIAGSAIPAALATPRARTGITHTGSRTSATHARASQTSTSTSGAPSGASGTPTMTPLTVSVDTTRQGAPVPTDFLGLSYEVKDLPRVASLAGHGDFVSMLKSLGTGVLRFGGVTADTQVAWLDPATGQMPSWATTALYPSDLQNLARLAQASGWRVLLTVNLGHFDPAAAADEARTAQQDLGSSLEAIELGNEPAAYANEGLRQAPYGFTQYQQDVQAYRSAISAAAPGVAIAGPDAGTAPKNLSWAMNEAQDVHPALITSHLYGTSWCNGFLPTAAYLLGRQIQKGEQTNLLALSQLQTKEKIPVRLDETNNISCGGEPGVSDTYSSALWAVDLLTHTMSLPFGGVNFHDFVQNPTGYSPLAALNAADLASGTIAARAEWYGLLLARQVEGDRPLPVTLGISGLNVAAWAGRTSGGDLQVIIDDEQPAGSRPLLVELPRSRGTRAASILRLEGPGITSTTGVTLGGREVAADGTWHATSVLPHANLVTGRVDVVVDPHSAALVSTEHYPGE
jgi:hypothetical protein